MSAVDSAAPRVLRTGPKADALGLAFFVFHLAVVAFLLFGWAAPSRDILAVYLVLLPAVALQWRVNRGSCVINNLESLIRTGRWRDPANREEAGFIRMLLQWWFGTSPSRAALAGVSYAAVSMLWLVAAIRYGASA